MSRRNPYVAAWRVRTRNAWREGGVLAFAPSVLAPVVATALLVPLVRPVFLSFLDRPMDGWGEGMAAVLLRLGAVIVGWLAIDVYAAVVRGPDRDVLATLPVDAGEVVRYELLRVAVDRWWVLPASATLLAPVALAGAVGLWAAGLVVLVGAWGMGLVVSAAVHLLAVDIAESPRWAPLLDLVRGHNPRPQAAFLYAPGAVLLLCGVLVAWGASEVAGVAAGEPASWFGLLAPGALIGAAWTRLDGLARGAWFRGSAVLAEIDARYAALADREEALRVYLEWTVRWLPRRVATYALKDLRHGWRERRTLVTGAWLVGLAALAAGWTAAPTGPRDAAIVAVGGVSLVAALAVLLERDEPEFLRVWLPSGGSAALIARVFVVGLWLQPCVWLGATAVAVRRGVSEAAVVVVAGEATAVFALALALICARSPRGLALYAPVATVAAAAVAVVLRGWS